MAKEKKEKVLKDKKFYKRAKNISFLLSLICGLIIISGLALGIYSAEKNSDIYARYTSSDEYKAIYTKDIIKVKNAYHNGEIDFLEYRKKYFSMRSNNLQYVQNNLERSNSEIKQENSKNNLALGIGMGAMAAGIVGAIATGTIASRQEDHYQDELELEKKK